MRERLNICIKTYLYIIYKKKLKKCLVLNLLSYQIIETNGSKDSKDMRSSEFFPGISSLHFLYSNIFNKFVIF